ncbi:hypothetical protein HYW94_03735 [Candidatus Uhrbacteria bacterium]|nr:hypothetical protein [Candidatus Uhrbacteria bacterium]
MNAFVSHVRMWLSENWNKPEFQFRLQHFVPVRRNRELLSHFFGWSQAWPDASLGEWLTALLGEPKFKNKTSDSMESALKDALIQTGCKYLEMDKRSLTELQVANRKFSLVMQAAGKIDQQSASPSPVLSPQVSVHNVLFGSFTYKLNELEEERDRLGTLVNSAGNLAEKLSGTQVDLKVARQERAKLEENIKKMFNEIKGNLSSTDLSDVERAQNKMSEYKALIEKRDEVCEMVESFERDVAVLRKTMEEQKNGAGKQKVLSQDIETLIKAAEILGIMLQTKTALKVKPAKSTAKSKKGDGNSRRKGNRRVLLAFSGSVSSSPSPSADQAPSSSQFVLSEDQRGRINQLNDGDWYGQKFGHSGVMSAASQDPAFKTKADFLQAMIDRSFSQKAATLPGSSDYGLLRCISAVRNRIASFPIWDGEWKGGGDVIPDAVEQFIQSREQAAQPQAS